MQLFTAPDRIPTISNDPTVFLAGSIDDGAAVDWQSHVIDRLKKEKVTLYNPRRANWVKNPTKFELNEQIYWELNALDAADGILFYFAPGSISPVTMLELGLYINRPGTVICCPEEFWRSTNIQVTCRKHGKQVFTDLDLAIAEVHTAASVFKKRNS
jgi:hypothetical protein